MRLSSQLVLFQKILNLCASWQMQLYLWGPASLGLGFLEKSPVSGNWVANSFRLAV